MRNNEESQGQLLNEWVKSCHFSHAFTIMPGVQTFTPDDMLSIATDCRYALLRGLFGRKEPVQKSGTSNQSLWFVAVAELSLGKAIWHLHGMLNIKNPRVAEKLARHGEQMLLSACLRHYGSNGIQADCASVDLSALQTPVRFCDYMNKRGWMDSLEGNRFIL